ncbi:magnesium transporter [Chondromyces apiculatus]|uniref:Magnesium transporter MgtE n=1 Tax=Chondromyces apiculatus DSM 436 TaxID=1192034 RepID=A0A017ST31_9BACT|nr:magnesium transporter [Chondromyces apiculatus]EYF00104.1 Mg/Co/Ni transporter MgtE [Chondromyces apiculatus DSM 436]
METQPTDREEPVTLTSAELVERWSGLEEPEELAAAFHRLEREESDEFFLALTAHEQAALLQALPRGERRLWIRLLAPDDAADVLQKVEAPELREELLGLLDEATRREVKALLAYAEDAAGGLMSPLFARVRPESTADEAIRYLRRQAEGDLETVSYGYVLDAEQRLVGVVSLRQLITTRGDRKVQDLMTSDVVSVREDTDQEDVARVFAQHHLMAIPVLDGEGRLKGIITADDIVDVVEEEATEDIQKLGGMEALDAPYLRTPLLRMVQKRAGWLSALFLGEMLTATAMARYEDEIARAVVLALFVPLIISSGGNSGSQATTLVIRAMALGELRPVDLLRVLRREVLSGLLLGCTLGVIGFARIMIWQALFHTYGEHATRVAITVAVSLVGVVLFGTLAGSLLPFLLRKLRFDPASASAPFVATLVDVSGLVIYFSVADLVLRGTML